MRVALHHDIEKLDQWRDGLWAALKILREKHEFVGKDEPADVQLLWTGSQSPKIAEIKALPGVKVWLYAGGHAKDTGFDYTVVEDDFAQEEFHKLGVDAWKAFGTNTDLFRPIPGITKTYRVIFPAAFAAWKRHDLLVSWVKDAGGDPSRVLVVGHKQAVETECYEVCQNAGFVVLDEVSPEDLAVYYNQSEACWIPSSAYGGSQRTVWEARACGLPVRIAPDNLRLQQLGAQPVRSHHYYATLLEQLLADVERSRTLPSLVPA